MKLCLVWWNTSLAPGGKTQSTKCQQQYALSMIRFFIETLNADIIGLCELTSKEIEIISEEIKDLEYSIFNGNMKAGNSYFDTCIIYKRTKLYLTSHLSIEKKHARRTFKVAQRVDFEITETKSPIHIFISHWPSRMNHLQYETSRRLLGQTLRNSIDDLTPEYIEKVPVVLMGDYNDEPFDPSISDDLLATRDRNFLSKKGELLYNPFWRKLGHRCEYTHNSMETTSEGGTYFYKSDHFSRWKTYDQMMFSSALLGNSEWHLNESLTSTLELSDHRKVVLDKTQTFDHIPIVSVLERS